MNLESIKNALTQKTGRAGLYLQKYSPEILLGAGLVGMVATVIMASKASMNVKTLNIITKASFAAVKEHEEEGRTADDQPYSSEDATKERAVLAVQTGLAYAKLYGPALGVGVLSIAAILASHGVMANRQVALVAAYNLLSEGFKNYRQRVVEELGEEKDSQYYLGLKEETYTIKETDPEGKTTKTKKTMLVTDGNMPSMYARCFDNSNPMFRADRLLNRAFLTAQERYANDVLILRGHLFLNEVYERLGFPHTTEGQLVGWVLRSPEQMKAEKRDGYISFGLEDSNANREFMRGENDAIWLDFNVDGIVHTLI